MPRSYGENVSTPRLYSGILYDLDEAFSLADAHRWQDWLASHRVFYADLLEGSFTARREARGDLRWFFWYGYRRHNKKTYKVYLGRSEDLTLDKLRAAAGQLAVKIAS